MSNNPIPIVVASSGPIPPATPPKQKQSKKKIILLVAIILVVAIALSGGYFGLLKTGVLSKIGIGEDLSTVAFRVSPERSVIIANSYNNILSPGPENALAIDSLANPEEACYSLADLDGDREPELLVAGDDTRGKTWLRVFSAPIDPTSDAAVSRGTLTWENTSAKDLLAGIQTPAANSGAAGIKVPTAPSKNMAAENPDLSAAAVYIVLKGLQALAYSEPQTVTFTDGKKVKATDKDYTKIQPPMAYFGDTSVLDDFVAGASDKAPKLEETTLEMLWKYQLEHFRELPLAKGSLDGESGQNSTWSPSNYSIQDINGDGYPELIVQVLEMIVHGSLPAIYVFTYDPKTGQAYAVLAQDPDQNNLDSSTVYVDWFGANQWGVLARRSIKPDYNEVYELWELKDKQIVKSDISYTTSNKTLKPYEVPEPKLQSTYNPSQMNDLDSGFKLQFLNALRVNHPLAPVANDGFQKTEDKSATNMSQSNSRVDWTKEKAKAEEQGLNFFHGTLHTADWNGVIELTPGKQHNTEIPIGHDDGEQLTFITADSAQTLDYDSASPIIETDRKRTVDLEVIYLYDNSLKDALKDYDNQEVGIAFEWQESSRGHDFSMLPTAGLYVNGYQYIISPKGKTENNQAYEKHNKSKKDWNDQKSQAENNGSNFFHGTVHIGTMDQLLKVTPDSVHYKNVNSNTTRSSDKFVILVSDRSQTLYFDGSEIPNTTTDPKLRHDYKVIYITESNAVEDFKKYDNKEIGVTFDWNKAHLSYDLDNVVINGLSVYQYKEISK